MAFELVLLFYHTNRIHVFHDMVTLALVETGRKFGRAVNARDHVSLATSSSDLPTHLCPSNNTSSEHIRPEPQRLVYAREALLNNYISWSSWGVTNSLDAANGVLPWRFELFSSCTINLIRNVVRAGMGSDICVPLV
jgi:hypothetical protein